MKPAMFLKALIIASAMLSSSRAFLPDEVTADLEPQTVLAFLEELFDQASENLNPVRRSHKQRQRLGIAFLKKKRKESVDTCHPEARLTSCSPLFWIT